MSPLFDIGVNLTNNRFNDDLQQVLARSKEAGVQGLLLTGTSEAESAAALNICHNYPDCWSTAGVHPHDAANVSENFIAQLRHLARDDKVLAIGECGLDFNRNFSPREAQLSVFQQQIELATELNLPLFLHERDAFDEQIKMLSAVNRLRGVAHCFTGTPAQMQAYLALGLYIGITGWVCDPRRGQDLQEAVKHLPLERLLLETDAPFLTPKTLPGKIRRNEPCYLPHIAETVADLKQISVEEVARAATHNAQTLLGFALN
ncbi:TatD family hydrolase [Planctobacterium marinum]|uniref:TatD family hydrolase n=1 Tax=Planctobacterium marinum TaxID=1631968 RepID=UPI001E63F5B8|nr:TatD family hydrolase [Planctobacterium marinum]MCC2607059.1 YchF/TatD family DNA exonuclease [Planctobacterium marinum]